MVNACFIDVDRQTVIGLLQPNRAITITIAIIPSFNMIIYRLQISDRINTLNVISTMSANVLMSTGLMHQQRLRW
jgi:hypothetical protein